MSLIKETMSDSSIPSDRRCEAFWSKVQKVQPDYAELELDPESQSFHDTIFKTLEERNVPQESIT